MYNYFKPYIDYFWEWDTDYPDTGEDPSYIAIIPNGQSIAYFDTILESLEDLSGQGIPPFGAILLVLIATNDGIQNPSFNKLKTDLLNEHGVNNKTITNAIEVLEYIRALPNTYKTGDTKTQLLQTLFQNCHNKLGLKKSKQLISDAKRGLSDYIVNQDKTDVTNATIEQDIRPIALLVRRFKSTEDIINAINKVPKSEAFAETIEIEDRLSPPLDSDKSFIEQLVDNRKTYQIGSLIKRIWSGLNIPMHNNLPSNQPLGGVSDITNKGDFSRLLISEFAYDDDTFMSRIANNEALYIERETPPENNNKQRVFLIDTSLKNWGVPKVLSFAATLAIATHPKSDFSYTAYVIGEHYNEAPLHSILNVIESQQLLTGTIHCAKGLQTFLEDHPNDGSRELFFLTEEDNLNHSSLQHVIFNFHDAINYIITNNTNGDLNFYKHQNKSRKHFQHILLPYQELWDSQLPKPEITKSLKNKDLQLKHILLESIDKSNAIIIPYEDEIYIIQNFNLYSLTSKGVKKGIQLVYEDIPYHQSYRYTIISNERNERVLVSFSNRIKQTERLNLTTKELVVKRIYSKAFDNNPVLFYTSNNNIILTNKRDFWSIATDFKLYKLNGGASYEESLLNFQDTILNFTKQLKANNTNYSILKNVEYITIKYNKRVKHENIAPYFLKISGCILEKTQLQNEQKSMYHDSLYDHSIDFIAKTTLYLKRIDGTPLNVIKFLKETLNISLHSSREMIANTPSIIVSNYTMKDAKVLKEKIENLGAICFIKINYFEAKDGSTIHIENGQFIFNSSQSVIIPQFYITSVLNYEIAMATDGEFAGNDYFLPVNNTLTTINTDDFYSKYINPFIQHIIDYED